MKAILRLIRRFFHGPPDAGPPAVDPPSVEGEAPAPKPGGPVREMQSGEYRITLDLGTQVLGLEVPKDLRWIGQEEVPVSPVLPHVAGRQPFASAAVLAQKAKIFDDGLYAAVDLMAQRGAGSYAGKVGLLRTLSSRLASFPLSDGEQETVPIIVGCAAMLGSVTAGPWPPGFQAGVQRCVSAFLADELQSKPMGFYTWTPELSALFRQDRMLQRKLFGATGIAALVRALHEDPELRAAYEGYLRLVAKLTNPLSPDRPDLRSLLVQFDKGAEPTPSGDHWFFPPSRTHETELCKALYGNRPIPPDFDLMAEMMERIRQGDLNLALVPDSGWYDYQTWALEPLVIPERMPEAGKLQLGPEYRKLLLELAKGIWALTRETHLKQMEAQRIGSSAIPRQREKIIHIDPELSAEPLPIFYLRRARSYHFVRTALCEIFGVDALRGAARLTPDGPVGLDLHAELVAMEALFYGAHAAVSQELGLYPEKSPPLGGGEGPEADARGFRAFVGTMNRDADLARDLRMMVPVFYDVERRRTKVWVFLGWAGKPADLRFATPPAATVVDSKGQDAQHQVRVQFHSTTRWLHYPVTAEVYVDRLLDRDEFRRHCDKYKTRSAVLANLG